MKLFTDRDSAGAYHRRMKLPRLTNLPEKPTPTRSGWVAIALTVAGLAEIAVGVSGVLEALASLTRTIVELLK